MVLGALLRAFAALDSSEVNALLDDAFSTYQVETVCMSLLQPLVQRAADLSAEGQLTIIEEQFGATLVRNRLATLLDTTTMPTSGPLVLLACAPGENHEIGPLIVATLWRRVGLQTIYLGPDVAEEALVAETRRRRPALVCLSAATEPGARSVSHLASALARLDPPRPIMGFGGGAFVRMPDLQRRIKGGLFLGVDGTVATRHAIQLLQEGPVGPG
jgi:methanogenic corrinoid protein MtbC1